MLAKFKLLLYNHSFRYFEILIGITGFVSIDGCYQGNLFTGGGKVGLLGAIGKYDFFVAKLAASTCGTAVGTE